MGVIEGSSELGLSQAEYADLTQEERDSRINAVREKFLKAGADAVILNLSELSGIIKARSGER